MIESGVRVHLSTFSHEKADIPSAFTMKIRRHCRTKRLESVRQLGMDRIVHFTFGAGEQAFHLIVELFAKGNIILTDWTGKVLTLLRTHKYSEDYEVRTGNLYRFSDAQPVPEVSLPLLRQALAMPDTTLGNALNVTFNMGSQLVDHCLFQVGLSSKRALTKNPVSDEKQIDTLYKALLETSRLLSALKSGEEPAKGYIILKKEAAAAGLSEEGETPEALRLKKIALYDDFSPVALAQFADRRVESFDTFHRAVDEFFTGMDQAKEVKQVGEKESHVDKRVDKAKRDQLVRVTKLEEQEMTNQEKARLIELNLAEVDQAIAIIRSGLESGMDWNHLEHIVKTEQRNGNPIAGLIHALKLQDNCVQLLLSDPLEEATEQAKVVDIDLALSAYANVRHYYDTMKKVKDKKEKTLAVTDGVVGRATKKAEKSAGEMKSKVVIQALRKTHWWEKFHWFISSDGLVVIAGRDAQQNELLVRRYMKKGDAYVHAEVHGAASCIVKSKTQMEQELPVDTLAQAGMMTTCRSNAWNAKIPVSAWWVHPDQVSKTAQPGEYLVTGSFMIRGKKNMLPAGTMTMGIAVLFRISSDSAARNHADDHLRRGAVKESDSEWEGADQEHDDGDDDDDDDHEDGNDEDESDEKEEQQTETSLDSRFQLQISAETTELHEEKKKDNSDDDDDDDDDDNDGEGDGNKGDEDLAASGAAREIAVEKKGLSIAEKKRLKKLRKKKEEGVEITEPAVVSKPPKEKPVVEKKVKGKHGKLKKIAKKYKDQTPEERAQMELLLHGSGKKQLEAKAKAEQEVEIASGLQELMEEDGSDKQAHGSRAGRRAAEKQEVAAILEEEKIQLAEALMGGDELELGTLTGDPKPDDEILYAMYMCAPWSALGGYKYKVKVVPGPPGKKSKVATQAVTIFTKQAEASHPREADVIKAIPDEEILHLFPPNSRLLLGLMGGPAKGGAGGAKKKGGMKRKGANKRANRGK